MCEMYTVSISCAYDSRYMSERAGFAATGSSGKRRDGKKKPEDRAWKISDEGKIGQQE